MDYTDALAKMIAAGERGWYPEPHKSAHVAAAERCVTEGWATRRISHATIHTPKMIRYAVTPTGVAETRCEHPGCAATGSGRFLESNANDPDDGPDVWECREHWMARFAHLDGPDADPPTDLPF